MTWQRATEIVPGRTYSQSDDGLYPWVARTATCDCGVWCYTYADAHAEEFHVYGGWCGNGTMPYEQPLTPNVVLAPMLVGELRPNDNGDKPTAVFVDGELVAVFAAGHQDRASAYAEHLKGGA